MPTEFNEQLLIIRGDIRCNDPVAATDVKDLNERRVGYQWLKPSLCTLCVLPPYNVLPTLLT